jgi:phage terminase large subunit
VPYDGSVLVNTAWDLGIGDDTAIWFWQKVGREVHLIDYYANRGQALPHYLSVIASKPYAYGKHYAPHDAEGRELFTGKSIAEMALAAGLRMDILPRLDVETGINAARVLFPRCYFDADACAKGLESLMNYRRDFNKRLDEFKPQPVHDWASHGADAFRYMAMAHKDESASTFAPLTYKRLTR